MSWYENHVPEVGFINKRLQEVIPENVEDANYARNIVAARTVFVMLYSFAIEGEDHEIRPSTVTVMTDEQAKKQLRDERLAWLKIMQSPKKPNIPLRWYQENTRESIRDDTIASMKQLGAIDELQGLPVTSSRPRYFLAKDFADLLNPALDGEALERLITQWRVNHLHKGALILQGLKEQERQSVITVELNDFKHSLEPGPSSVLTKAAVEIFAKRFLADPEVLLISTSKNKFKWQFSKLFDQLGLSLDPKKALPDVILAEKRKDKFRMVFIEIVHSDGPISGSRKNELIELAKENFNLEESDLAFVTVFTSRSSPAYRKVHGSLAWGSFVWFVDEPDRLIHIVDTNYLEGKYLIDLL